MHWRFIHNTRLLIQYRHLTFSDYRCSIGEYTFNIIQYDCNMCFEMLYAIVCHSTWITHKAHNTMWSKRLINDWTHRGDCEMCDGARWSVCEVRRVVHVALAFSKNWAVDGRPPLLFVSLLPCIKLFVLLFMQDFVWGSLELLRHCRDRMRQWQCSATFYWPMMDATAVGDTKHSFLWDPNLPSFPRQGYLRRPADDSRKGNKQEDLELL